MSQGLHLLGLIFLPSILPHRYKDVSHVLLHNRAGAAAGFGADVCRSVADRLAASPSFRLMITTAPLPWQTSLVHIGEAVLRPSAQEASEEQSGAAPTSSCLSDTGIWENRKDERSSVGDDVLDPSTWFLGVSNALRSSGDGGRTRRVSRDSTPVPQQSRSSTPRHTPAEGVQSSQRRLSLQRRLSSDGGPALFSSSGDGNSEPRHVYLYSTSFDAAPTATLAALYCSAGVCCLPSQAFYATPMSKGPEERAPKTTEVTMAALRISEHRDVLISDARSREVSRGGSSDGGAPSLGGGEVTPPAQAAAPPSVMMRAVCLPPLAAHTSAYQDMLHT